MNYQEPLTVERHPLFETMAHLRSVNEEFRSHLLNAPDDNADWLTVTALTLNHSTHLQKLFARVVTRFPTQDKRAPAALWFAQYAFAIQAVAIACYLSARRVPDMNPKFVCARFEDDGDMGAFAWQSPRFFALPDDADAAHLDCRVVDSHDALRVVLREQMIQHLALMVDAIRLRSPFGKPGMWTLAADYCAMAFAWVAEQFGNPELGVTEARLFGTSSSRLALKRDFILIEQNSLRYHMLDRTACCLYYKCGQGEYCSSCPHRPKEERVQLIRNWLEKRATENIAA